MNTDTTDDYQCYMYRCDCTEVPKFRTGHFCATSELCANAMPPTQHLLLNSRRIKQKPTGSGIVIFQMVAGTNFPRIWTRPPQTKQSNRPLLTYSRHYSTVARGPGGNCGHQMIHMTSLKQPQHLNALPQRHDIEMQQLPSRKHESSCAVEIQTQSLVRHSLVSGTVSC